MEALKEPLKEILCREGAEKWGVADFSALLPYGFPRGVSVAVSLPRHMVEELKEGPTREYYYLYKELNARLDRIITAGARFLEERGYESRAITSDHTEFIDPYRSVLPHKTAARLEFEAFSDYFLGEPAISHMVWKIIPEGEARTAALENGDVDFLMDVENTDYQRLTQNEGIEVTEFLSTGPTWLMLNNEVAGLDNIWVRRAINAAIDREAVIDQALGGLGQAAVGQAPFNLPGYSEENAQGYDLPLAREYLERSGVDAQDIGLSIICSSDTKRRAAQVIVQNLAEIGIEAKVESMDLATYLATTTQGNYSGAIGGYTTSTMLGYMTAVFHSKSIGSTNKTLLRNDELDALIDQAQETTDRAQRIAILEQACALANSLCTQAPLYQPVELRAYKKGLQGVEVGPSGKLYFENISWAG